MQARQTRRRAPVGLRNVLILHRYSDVLWETPIDAVKRSKGSSEVGLTTRTTERRPIGKLRLKQGLSCDGATQRSTSAPVCQVPAFQPLKPANLGSLGMRIAPDPPSAAKVLRTVGGVLLHSPIKAKPMDAYLFAFPS